MSEVVLQGTSEGITGETSLGIITLELPGIIPEGTYEGMLNKTL